MDEVRAGRRELAGRLGEALRGVGFTYDGVAELLGPLAHEALGRNETTPACAGRPGAPRSRR